MKYLIEQTLVERVQSRVLDWYEMNRKDFPWRQTSDPYRIWVSEVMLQQTRSATVISYYNRFIAQFPDVKQLARAQDNELMKAWEGFGYYSRALALRESARIIERDFDGRIPCDIDDLIRLPGIGPYTSGAIASIAFGVPAPAIDGNAMRLISRLFLIRSPIDRARARDLVAKIVEQLIPASNPGEFNQGLMEIGSTVCLPKNPRCSLCPLQADCKVLEANLQETIPIKPSKARPRKVVAAVAAIRHASGDILIVKRQPGVLMGGLWNLPWWEVESHITPAEAMQKGAERDLNLELEAGAEFLAYLHRFTHIEMAVRAFRAVPLTRHWDPPNTVVTQWVPIRNLERFPFPAAHKPILDSLSGAGQAALPFE